MTGFESKRQMAANKLQEPVNLLEARRIAAEYGTPDSQVDDGNLYFALSKCLEHIDAQPVQPERLPLTDEQFNDLVMEHLGPHALTGGKMSVYDAFLKAVRATEAAHNIGAKP